MGLLINCQFIFSVSSTALTLGEMLCKMDACTVQWDKDHISDSLMLSCHRCSRNEFILSLSVCWIITAEGRRFSVWMLHIYSGRLTHSFTSIEDFIMCCWLSCATPKKSFFAFYRVVYLSFRKSVCLTSCLCHNSKSAQNWICQNVIQTGVITVNLK